MNIISKFQSHSLKTRVTLFTLAIFLASIWSLALFAGHTLRQDMQRLLGEQQFSTVSLMAAQVDEALSTRMQALERVAAEIAPYQMANPAILQRTLASRTVFQEFFSGGTFVTGPDGIAIASLPLTVQRLGVNYSDRDYIQAALREGKSHISRPLFGRAVKAPVFVLATPIHDQQGAVIGVLAGVVNLAMPNFLDRVSENQYGRTGYYVVVARQHRLIVTSSDKGRILEILPPADTSPTLDRFINGDEGTEIFVNPLGIEVLVAVKGIPTANWYAAVALPTAEAFAPIRAAHMNLLLATLALTLLAGGLTWMMLRRELAPLQSTATALASLPDLSKPMTPLPVQRQDEIGQVIAGFNRLLLELARRQETLSESEARYRTAFRTSPDAVSIARIADGRFLDINDGFSRLMGWAREEVIGLTSLELGIWRHRSDREQFIQVLQSTRHCKHLEYEWVARTGRTVTIQRSASLITLGGEECLLSVAHDISARKAAQEQIQQLVFSDPLTGLPNRRLFMERLEQSLSAALRHRRHGALIYVDLDEFKILNDTLGHDEGDRLLQMMAQRLKDCVREEDTVARIGGDEFVILLDHLSANSARAATEAKKVAETIRAALSPPYRFGTVDHHTTSSIGITLFGDRSENTAEPLKRADLAMYQAKALGRNRTRFFEPQMQALVNSRATMELNLREALQHDHLQLHYQAQVDDLGQVHGVEALLRWHDPKRGMVPPGEFIALAESSGLIVPMGQWVLETTCAQLARWADQPRLADLSIAVNVSSTQFMQDDFVDQVLGALNRSGANPGRLKLELTESLLVTDIDGVIAKMNVLKARGVGFSLDDFGTGFSSLSYLKRLPLDQLKIDQGFVRDILVEPNDLAIAKMVVALGNSLGLDVIAEGVETEAQRAVLASLGCHHYQGFLFGRPMPVDQFEASLRTRMDEPQAS